jgi:hypothetical protein
MRPLALLLVVVLFWPAHAQAPKVAAKGLDLAHLEINQIGRIKGGNVANFSVKSVLSETEALVQGFAMTATISGRGEKARPVERFAEWGSPFVLSGASTRGWIDGKQMSVPDVYRVANTRKIGARTVFVLELASAEEKAQVEAAEKAAHPPEPAPAPGANPKRPAAKAKAPKAPAPDNTYIPESKEQEATRKMKLAKSFLEDNNRDAARKRLHEIVEGYPGTKAAAEAKELLDKLNR